MRLWGLSDSGWNINRTHQPDEEENELCVARNVSYIIQHWWTDFVLCLCLIWKCFTSSNTSSECTDHSGSRAAMQLRYNQEEASAWEEIEAEALGLQGSTGREETSSVKAHIVPIQSVCVQLGHHTVVICMWSVWCESCSAKRHILLKLDFAHRTTTSKCRHGNPHTNVQCWAADASENTAASIINISHRLESKLIKFALVEQKSGQLWSWSPKISHKAKWQFVQEVT